MEKPANRVLLVFKNWEDRKKDIDPLLKSGLTDATTFSHLQLDYLCQARHRLNGEVRPDEKPFMILLNKQIGRLEKQLHPNLISRLFFRWKDKLVDGPVYIKQYQEQRTSNMESLKAQLRDAGFGSFAGRLEHHLDPEQRNARLPLDCQIGGEKRLSLYLHFEKDSYNNYQLNRIDSQLVYNKRVVREQLFDLREWPELNTNQVLNLLEGRAIRQQYADASGHQNHRWVELGSSGIQHYDPAYDFDIGTALAGLPAITRNKDDVIHYLQNGQQIATHWKQGNQSQSIYIQADPANRRIKLLDEKLRLTNPEKLNQRMMMNDSKVKTISKTVNRTKKEVKSGIRQKLS